MAYIQLSDIGITGVVKVFHKRRLVRWYLLPMVRIIKDRQRHMCCRRDFVCRNIVPALIFLSDVLHWCMEHKY